MTQNDNELQMLIELFCCLYLGKPIPIKLQAWLCNGILAAVTGRAETLDKALGLERDGAHRLATRFGRLLRNRVLAHALAHVDGSYDKLAIEVRRFAGWKWRIWKRDNKPPKRASPLEVVLFEAFKAAGGDVPNSPRGLRHAIKKDKAQRGRLPCGAA